MGESGPRRVDGHEARLTERVGPSITTRANDGPSGTKCFPDGTRKFGSAPTEAAVYLLRQEALGLEPRRDPLGLFDLEAEEGVRRVVHEL